MAKAGNEARIEMVLSELRKGVERKAIIRKFSKTFKVTDRTFDVLISKAKERLAVENQAKEKERQAKISEELKAEIQAEIASDLELDLVLSKIVKGGYEVEEIIRGTPILRSVSPMEMIAAADKLYKRRGSYAAVKQNVTVNKVGKDLEDETYE